MIFDSLDAATFLIALTNVLAFILSVCGALMVVWGAGKAARRAFWTEAEPWKGAQLSRLEDVRTSFGHRLLLGLDFFLGAEVLRLIVDLSQDQLIRVGAIALIRVILGLAITREIRLPVLDLRAKGSVRARV